MRRTLALTILATALFWPLASPAQTTDVAGVKFPNTVQVGNANLRLNGAGIRYKVVFKVYADLGDTDANRQRLYALNKALSATIPRAEPQPFADFDTYVQRRLLPVTSPHSGIYLAVDGDQWIGMSQISLHDERLPEPSARGIAFRNEGPRPDLVTRLRSSRRGFRSRVNSASRDERH